MKKVRLGIIGTGGIALHHLGYLHRVEGAEVVALCDIDPEALNKAAAKAVAGRKLQTFSSHRKLLAAGVCDAVIIGTPHYFHPPIAIDAFKKGVHVLTEKPVAVHTKGAKRAIAAPKRTRGLVYAAMFQHRTEPIWRTARGIVERGALGDLRRVTWVMTDWFRSQAYYDSGGWRATWAGEGGGVLLNQCPHTLDMLTWLAGVPSRVTAHCALGKYHRIEVEDEVSALLEYPNGAVGHFATSTAEAPGINRLEIVGDRGTMIVEHNKIKLMRTTVSVREYSNTTSERFKEPEAVTDEVSAERLLETPHMLITQNFVNAILKGEKLIAPAAEGIRGLALGNAILMSGLSGKPVDIPFNDNEYARLIEGLAAKSSFRKTAGAKRDISLAGSFRH
jgi:predicted dehydrogenase